MRYVLHGGQVWQHIIDGEGIESGGKNASRGGGGGGSGGGGGGGGGGGVVAG